MRSILFLIALDNGCCSDPLCALENGTGGGQDAITIDMPFVEGYRSRCVQGAGGSYSHFYTSTRYDADFDTPNDENVPVYAPVSGTLHVHDSRPTRGFGIHANIDVGDGTYVILGHLAEVFVADGSEVAAGQLLGFEGTTGYSTGDHVHIGRHDGDAAADGTYGESIEGLAFSTSGGDVAVGELDCGLSDGATYASVLATAQWHPNGTLVKTPGASTVYLLEAGAARAFLTEEAFLSRGYAWSDIVLVDETELACYAEGESVSGSGTASASAAGFAEGSLVSEVSSSTVYVVGDGIAMPIETWDAFLLLGFGGRAVQEVDDGAVSAAQGGRVGSCSTNTYCITREDVTACGGPDPEDEGTFAPPESSEDTAETDTAEDGLVVTWTAPGGRTASRITLAGEYAAADGTTESWRTLAETAPAAALSYAVPSAVSGDSLRFSVEFVVDGATSWSCLAPYPPGTVQGTSAATMNGAAVAVEVADDPSSDGCGLRVTVP